MNKHKFSVLGSKYEVMKATNKIDDGKNIEVVGNPSASVTRYVTHPSGAMNTGIWECEVGEWTAVQPSTEMFTILEGRVKITDGEGVVHDLEAGDTMYVPRGAKVHWNVVATVKKAWVMMPQLDVA